MQYLQPGTMLRQYKVQKVLGAGGFGVTYLVKDENLDKLFAIKEYYPESFAHRTGQTIKANAANVDDFVWGKERFMAEARVLARFRHPNIVGVTQIFEANRTAYIVLEYQSGHSLTEWLTELGRHPSQVEIDAIVEPILSALDTIHRNDLLHRDIAPDNIYIRDDGSPVLIDFGSAREAIAQRTKTLSAIVKTGYSPAEQYSTRGSGQGPWSDIYAFAATLYRAITGEHPEEATDRMLADNYVPASQATKGDYRLAFLDAIDWGLKLSPKERPQSVTEWRTALFSQATGAQISPAVTPNNEAGLRASIAQDKLQPPAPAAQKSKSSLLLYASALILVLGAGFIWFNAQVKDSPNRPIVESNNTNQSDDQGAKERDMFSRAHSNLAALKYYLETCKICGNSSEARTEIASIEEQQRLARARANFFNLEICNRTNYAVSTAVIGRKELSDASWTLKGWHNVSANSCAQVGRFAKGKIYTMAKINGEVPGWYGKDTKQCVEFPGPFERIISKDFTCPQTGKTLGFFENAVSETNYTWNITGVPTVSETEYFDFEVCNHSKLQARVAVMARKNPLAGDWTVEGWFRVSSGACSTIGKYAKKAIYSVALVAGSPRMGARGSDTKLCVEFPGPFSRVHTAGYKCHPNERLESFKLIEVPPGANKFTWGLNDANSQ